MKIQWDMSIFSSWYLPFLILPYSPFQKKKKKKKKPKKLDIIVYWVIGDWKGLDWRGHGTWLHSCKLSKRFQKNTTPVFIYQLAKFGDSMNCGSADWYRHNTMHYVCYIL